MLMLITVRSRETNDRCDDRASILEAQVGMKVVSNYLWRATAPARVRRFPELRLHDVLLFFDGILVVFWVGLVVLSLF
jgi:hypothetical protein